MAGSLNKAIIIGNLGRDPEVRYTQSGQAVCNFSVATNERWRDKGGNDQEQTEWHRVVTWGKLAEICGEHLGKGRMVYVEGRLQTREWSDRQGEKRYTTEIVAREVQFLDKGPRQGSADKGPGEDDFGPPPRPEEEGYGEDVPF